ncbi:MAG TPA: ATP-binding cassette domain-containing protein [Gammaproteobacteria bacterium]|nr:ATP-binding cassette domain-containing protein [Gammaproteobacteria bacterium]
MSSDQRGTRLRLQDLSITPVGPITLAIAPGQCVSLSSPSGSGKTRLLRAVADLVEHRGQVYMDDRECGQWEAPAWRRMVGFLPVESQWWDERVEPHFVHVESPWLAALGLSDSILERRVDYLSSGQRQRLALIRLMGNRPKALLLDEPTANLDGENAARVEAFIGAYRRDAGAAVIWVTHDPAQSRRVATAHYTLTDGALAPLPS